MLKYNDLQHSMENSAWFDIKSLKLPVKQHKNQVNAKKKTQQNLKSKKPKILDTKTFTR